MIQPPDFTSILISNEEIAGYLQRADSGAELEYDIYETEAPQDVTEGGKYDYIVWTYSGDPDNCMGGDVAGMTWELNVEVYASDQQRAHTIIGLVIDVLANKTVGPCWWGCNRHRATPRLGSGASSQISPCGPRTNNVWNPQLCGATRGEVSWVS